ncbi:MAG: GAF domain-containing protein [Bacteroidales bacterium]
MEKLIIPAGDKTRVYEALIPQIKSLTEGENDLYANLANITAVLKESFNFFWVGFYLVKSDNSEFGNSLVLGPFQGPIACTRIAYGKGVCGTAWKQAKCLNVPDVDQFPDHIACSSSSRSEIVVPVSSRNEIIAVLDIDSVELNTFDSTDEKYLKKIVSCIK